MGRTPVTVGVKRGRPASSSSGALSDADQKLYDLIKNKEGMGIPLFEIKRQLGIQDAAARKSLKSLQMKNLIKDVPNIHNKGQRHYMAVEFEPSKAVSGGSWYTGGKHDVELIKIMKELCLKHIDRLNEKSKATLKGIADSIRMSGAFKIEFSMGEIDEIVQSLILDNEVEDVISTGVGDFCLVQPGTVCYQRVNGRNAGVGVLASIPCGVCPQISECTPDGGWFGIWNLESGIWNLETSIHNGTVVILSALCIDVTSDTAINQRLLVYEVGAGDGKTYFYKLMSVVDMQFTNSTCWGRKRAEISLAKVPVGTRLVSIGTRTR
ncbi:hypothetical protein ACLOJK_040347 [Asimina triloba]